VGWDVHKAIVDNLRANTRDEANAIFALPAYMTRLMDAGHMGDKTPDKGGFFRRSGKGKEAKTFVLEPRPSAYVELGKPEIPEVARKMKQLHRVGRYKEAFDVFSGLGRVGEVVEAPADVDRIMGYGFNWAPPSVLVDLIGAKRAIALLEASKLPVPAVVGEAATRGTRLFDDKHVDIGRFFHG
jgi:3-hydroxyacyl-CoA dehydrogenase